MEKIALLVSLALSSALAAEPAAGAACGAGVGDLRESARAKSACGACVGKLVYETSAADGLGYTTCVGGRGLSQNLAPVSPVCGAGVGDRRDFAASQSACQACHGMLDYDVSAADGLGYTACKGGHLAAPQTQACGAGVGDLREFAASMSACAACHGTLDYDASAADGLGYTACNGGQLAARQTHPQQSAPAAAPQPPACGAGVGDLRELAASRSACGACHGTLDYDASAADGLGYTACAGGQSNAPAAVAHHDYRTNCRWFCPEPAGAAAPGAAPGAPASEAGKGPIFGNWGRQLGSVEVLVVASLAALLAKVLWVRYRPGAAMSSRELAEADLKADPAKPAKGTGTDPCLAV